MSPEEIIATVKRGLRNCYVAINLVDEFTIYVDKYGITLGSCLLAENTTLEDIQRFIAFIYMEVGDYNRMFPKCSMLHYGKKDVEHAEQQRQVLLAYGIWQDGEVV